MCSEPPMDPAIIAQVPRHYHKNPTNNGLTSNCNVMVLKIDVKDTFLQWEWGRISVPNRPQMEHCTVTAALQFTINKYDYSK